MIIFYNKQTGVISGTIDGRVHKDHMNMWVGDKETNDRLVFEWKRLEDGSWSLSDEQAELIFDIEQGKVDLRNCLIDVEEKKLICQQTKK